MELILYSKHLKIRGIMTDELIGKLITWIEAGGEFVKSQVPEYVEQLIKVSTIKLYLDIFYLLIVIILSSLLFYACIKTIRSCIDTRDIPPIVAVGTFICPAIMFLFFVQLTFTINNLITLKVAPKVYVVEHLKKLTENKDK